MITHCISQAKLCVVVLGLLACLVPAAQTAAGPTVDLALKLKPTQPDVDFDRPNTEEAARCEIKATKAQKKSGWVVRDESGRLLRRFFDSNNDNVVDQWCYYRDGIEVYRDVDSDFDRKADQFRWLNTAGRRWGIDTNKDGKIDRWKAISAQEVSAEIVAALARGDADRFALVLITKREIDDLALDTEKKKSLTQMAADAVAGFRKSTLERSELSRETRWIHFSASQPGLVPTEDDDTASEILVYENVVALTETDGKQGLVQVGTLVQVGDTWKAIAAPSIGSNDATAASNGFFFETDDNQLRGLAGGAAPGANQLQELLVVLDRLQRAVASAKPSDRANNYEEQAQILEKLVDVSVDQSQKHEWTRQSADTISAAVQAGDFPDGTARLLKLAKKLEADGADIDLVAYVRYRELLAGYSLALQDPKADYAKIQTQWQQDLEKFVADYAESEDAAEAVLQLAIAYEFAGEEDNAKKWYRKIATKYPDTTQAKKADGATRRLESVGQPLSFRGQTIDGGIADLSRYRGRLVVLQFWASWCEPCKADMTVLKSLLAKYGSKFSVLAVNIDQDRNAAVQTIKEKGLNWANIHEPGGLDSRPATDLGILTLPTMLLIDQAGRVVNRNIHAAELESELKKRLR